MTNIQEYKELCQKGSDENYLLDKYILRKISIYFTIIAIKLKIHPNTVTLVSLLCALGSLFPLSTNDPLWVSLGCFLILSYNLLDHVDGELARYYINKNLMTPNIKGQYFDVLCHSYSNNLMFFFTGWGVYNAYGYELGLLLGILACIVTSGFPNLVASKLIMMKINNNPEVVTDPAMLEISYSIERKKQQIEDINTSIFSKRKLNKLVQESFGFPGMLYLIIFANLLDIYVTPQHAFGFFLDFRILLLVAVCGGQTLYTIRRTTYWMKLFSKIQ